MAFDINKYSGETFNDDQVIDRKIKALLIWFEYQISIRDYSINEQIHMVDNILKLCVKEEWYEIAVFFKKKKIELLQK
jgi:hypothetical protein